MKLGKMVIISLFMALFIAMPVFGALGSSGGTMLDRSFYVTAGGPLDQIGLPKAGIITACTNATTVSSAITVPSFANWYTDVFSSDRVSPGCGQYYLQVVSVDDADADTTFLGQFRIIRSMTSAGVITVIPAFGSGTSKALDADDWVVIRHFNDINPNPNIHYEGYASGGSATTAVLPDLIGNLEAIRDNALITVIKDLSATTDDGKQSICTGWNAVSGTVTFTTGMMTVAVGDYIMIDWSLAMQFINGAAGLPFVPTAGKIAAGKNLAEGMLYNSNQLDDLVTDIGGWSAWDTTIVDFAHAAWLDVASSQWLAITGSVELEVAFYCSTSVTVTSADSLLITDEAGLVFGCWLGADILIGTWLRPNTGLAWLKYPDPPSIYWRGNILHGVFQGEINGLIDDHVFTAGIIIVCWRYRDAPFYTGGSVASGSGN